MITTFATRHGSPGSQRRTRRHTTLIALALVLLATAGLMAGAAGAQDTTTSTSSAATTATTTTARTTSAPAKPAPKPKPKTTAATAPAEDDPENLPIPEGTGGPVSVSSGMGGTLMRLIFGLALVTGLIFAVWHVLKRVQRSRFPAVEPDVNGLIGVVATTPLGPNRALHLIRVGDEVVLVGATEHAVQAVARLDAATADAIARAMPGDGVGAEARARAVETSGAAESFIDRLRRLTTRP